MSSLKILSSFFCFVFLATTLYCCKDICEISLISGFPHFLHCDFYWLSNVSSQWVQFLCCEIQLVVFWETLCQLRNEEWLLSDYITTETKLVKCWTTCCPYRGFPSPHNGTLGIIFNGLPPSLWLSLSQSVPDFSVWLSSNDIKSVLKNSNYFKMINEITCF